MRPRAFSLLFLLLAWCCLSIPVQAHKLAPSLLELHEAGGGDYELAWKTPRFSPTPVAIVPRLPDFCTDIGERRAQYEGTGVRVAWRVHCAEPLAGSLLRVDGLAENQSAALIRIDWAGGEISQGLINGGQAGFRVPVPAGALQVSWDYTQLGVRHILGGADHLLFVLGLLLLAGNLRRLVWTVTAFTAGHSVTLALAALGVLRYPVDLVECAIALSIFAVAVALARADAEPDWMRRYPWSVAALFGLLHGMGFAGALREVGLPASDIPLALLAFNIGIEIGQLAFVAVALLLAVGFRRSPLARQSWLAWVPVYLIGVLSAYWSIERGLAAVASF